MSKTQTSHLHHVPVSTVTFVRILDEDYALQKVIRADWDTNDLLDHYREAVVNEIEGLGFQVLRVVAVQTDGDSQHPGVVDFWDGDYRVDSVRVCLELVGDVADRLYQHARRAEITNSYTLGNQTGRCAHEVSQGFQGDTGLEATCRKAA
jgi:hypothetical protein